MKRILVYGDSNTWGAKQFRGRYDDSEQWPNILQTMTGGDFKIIQEGLRGRIAGDHNKSEPYRNGKTSYEVVLRTAMPVDYVIIALGSNDVKTQYGLSAQQIVNDLLWYSDRTKEIIGSDNRVVSSHKMIFLGIPESRSSDEYQPTPGLRKEVNQLLERSGEIYIPFDGFEVSDDGVHFNKDDHQRAAQIIYDKFQELDI